MEKSEKELSDKIKQAKEPTNGSRLKKSSSFNGTQVKKYSRRKLHTVPSDKNEQQQIDAFRSEALRKAIQWNMVDILDHSQVFKDDDVNDCNFLTSAEWKAVLALSGNNRRYRKFLCFLMRKSFDTMRKWLTTCDVGEEKLKKVWETYEEFSSKERNQKKMKCFVCRLTSELSVTFVADRLYSADIITEDLYEQCFTCEAPTGLQQDLWKKVVEECNTYHASDIMLGALKITLNDASDGEQFNREDIQTLISEMQTLKKATRGLLKCYCSDICVKSLHPVSCVRKFPMTSIYSQRQPLKLKERSSNGKLLESDLSQNSSSERSNSDDTGAEGDCDTTRLSSSCESLSRDMQTLAIAGDSEQRVRDPNTDLTVKGSRPMLQENPGYVPVEMTSQRQSKNKQNVAFQQKLRNCSLKQAAGTRCLLKSGEKYLRKDVSESNRKCTHCGRCSSTCENTGTGTKLPNGLFLTCNNAYFHCSKNFVSR